MGRLQGRKGTVCIIARALFTARGIVPSRTGPVPTCRGNKTVASGERRDGLAKTRRRENGGLSAKVVAWVAHEIMQREP